MNINYPQLGISLNQRLNNDEVVAVAFQYTNGQVFAEFVNDGVTATEVNQNPNATQQAVTNQTLL
jgi:hypothetical protein